jgi:hypothetical protein
VLDSPRLDGEAKISTKRDVIRRQGGLCKACSCIQLPEPVQAPRLPGRVNTQIRFPSLFPVGRARLAGRGRA